MLAHLGRIDTEFARIVTLAVEDLVAARNQWLGVYGRPLPDHPCTAKVEVVEG